MEGYVFWMQGTGYTENGGVSQLKSKAEADAHNKQLSQQEVDAVTKLPPVPRIDAYVHSTGTGIFAKPVEIHTWIGQPLAKVVEIGSKHPMPYQNWKRWVIAEAPNGRRYGGWQTNTRDLIYLKLLKE